MGKRYILSFLKKYNLGILSTIGEDGLPYAAPVYYLADRKFNVFFVTPIKTQKNINIQYKNDVLLTAVNEKTQELVSIRGKAFEEKGKIDYMLKHLSALLNIKLDVIVMLPLFKYHGQNNIVIKIEPTEVHMRRFSKGKLEEVSYTFDD